MVKGVTRQVIVMQSPDPKLFDQAIFILKDNAVGEGITDEQLLKEAKSVVRGEPGRKEKRRFRQTVLGAVYGAMLTGAVWLASVLL